MIKSFGQSHYGTLLETFCNIGSGFIISWAVFSWIIVPIFKIETSSGDNFMVVCIFTVSSIIRTYLWRRFFNKN